jgi:hypothetical protein
VYITLTGNGVRYGEGVYGIEVEAERLGVADSRGLTEGLPFASPQLQRLVDTLVWKATQDGSLRHRGVEFISVPMQKEHALHALSDLYSCMNDGLFAPSVRTGIHVHANVSQMENYELLQVMRAYAAAEPLLMQYVGVEREQNIYCVPLYRASNERQRWLEFASLLRLPTLRNKISSAARLLDACCKYSALNISPISRLGTVEFRHAPTFARFSDMRGWLDLVDATMRLRLPDAATVADLAPLRRAMPARLSWDEYEHRVLYTGALEFANDLAGRPYVIPEWGAPASLAFAPAKSVYPRFSTGAPPPLGRHTMELELTPEEEELLRQYTGDTPEQLVLEETI